MFSGIVKLSRHTLIYGAGHILARLVTFLLLPLYTNVFTRSDYGVISLAYTFIGFMIVILHYGLDSSLMKYYSPEGEEERKKYLSSAYVSYVITTAVFVLFFNLFRQPLSNIILGGNYPNFISIISLILAFDLLWFIPMLILRVEEKPTHYISISFVNVILSFSLNLLFVLKLEFGIFGVLLSNLITSIFLFLVTFPYVLKRIQLSSVSIMRWKKMIRFGLPFLPSGIFAMIMELADRYILKYMTDMETVGLYSAGYKLGMLMLLLVMGFNMGWQPFFLKTKSGEDRKTLFARITTYVLTVMGFVWVLLIIWIENIVQLNLGGITLYGSKYWESIVFVPWVALGYFFFAAYSLQLPGVFLTEKTKWVAIVRAIGAGMNIGLNIILIHYIGAIGAAIATCLSFLVMSLALYTINQRIYPIHYEWSRLLRIILFMVVVFFVLHTYDLSTIEKLILSVSYPVGLFFTGFLNQGERQRIFKTS